MEKQKTVEKKQLNLMSIQYNLWWHTAFAIISQEIRCDAAPVFQLKLLPLQTRDRKCVRLLNSESPPSNMFYK